MAKDDDTSEALGGQGGADTDDDLMAEARRTRRDVMRGLGGRNAIARLSAANKILESSELRHLTDEQLHAEARRFADEIRRRREAAP